MAQPFYMEYETRCNGMHGCIDSYKQFMNIQKHMKDPKTGLYYHGYDESREMYWADPRHRLQRQLLAARHGVVSGGDGGCAGTHGRNAVLRVSRHHVDAEGRRGRDDRVPRRRAVCSGRSLTKAGVEGNYLETSGSALFAYAVLKGVRLGYLPKRYAAYGEKAFYGTCDRHLGVGADGALQLGGICLVAGLGGATRRDGSLAYYFSEPIVENDAKGVGPLLLAYTEILAAQKQ